MPLPKIKHPTYELTLPSNGMRVTYRPFLVREEKILLLAKESSSQSAIVHAIKQVITNCIVSPADLDVDSLATFDVEYFFLNLRSKSVNNIVTLSFKDLEDERVYDIDVDLDQVIVRRQENHTNKIKVDEDTGITLRYPSLETYSKLNLENVDKLAIDAVAWCIESVYDNETVYTRTEFTEQELVEFIEDLDVITLQKIVDFFKTMPKLYYKISYKNAMGNERVVELDSLVDFFMLG